MPKVSIIIPVYNQERYLPKSLDTIINQTYKDLEIIIVNDGSTDNSLAICEAYANFDSRIILHTQKNQGVAAARNTGLKLATGDFVGFVDPDDYIDTSTYYLAVQFMTDDIDLVMWDINIYGDKESEVNVKGFSNYFKLKFFGKRALTDDDRYNLNEVFWNKLFRRSIIVEHNIDCPVGKLYEDLCFWYKYTMWAKNIYILPLKLYHYHLRAESLRGNVIRQKVDVETDRMYMLELLVDYCVDNNILNSQKTFFEKMFFYELQRSLLVTKNKKFIYFLADKVSKKFASRCKLAKV